ncbi:MAG: rhodanese-like domain-containing protein [Leptospirillia bacterium]
MDINRDCREVKSAIDDGADIVLLDVREPEERGFCAIEGSMHIPMASIPHHMQKLDAEREIVVVCHHGARSLQVANYLRANGFDKVYNMSGGIDAWSLTVDPQIPRYR